MKISRRTAFSLTAAGLVHVGTSGLDPFGAPVLDGAPGESIDHLIRRAADRGHTDLGWLKSHHSFSFGEYQDQRWMGFRSLRVINEDRITAGRGFPTHPHRDMEIISYVLDGALQHRDSTGHGAIITPDDVQVMSAGTGITHSEFNPSTTATNHFLQIWIQPAQKGHQPRYTEQRITSDQKQSRWNRIAGPEGSTAAVALRQDASIYAVQLRKGDTVDFTVEKSRHVWLQPARGTLQVNGTQLQSGDAIATSRPTQLHIEAVDAADVLLFDLG